MDEFRPKAVVVELPRAEAPETSHYRRIGHTLSVCEASSLRVGIPWMPPTRRVWNLRSHLEGSLEYYLRFNLVEIPTQSLESFYEDLLQHRGSPLFETFFLEEPEFLERWLFAILSVACLSIGTFCMFTAVQGDIGFSALVAIVVGGGAALFGTTLSSDEHRRLSFAWALSREIYRRKGLDPSGPGNLRACPT